MLRLRFASAGRDGEWWATLPDERLVTVADLSRFDETGGRPGSMIAWALRESRTRGAARTLASGAGGTIEDTLRTIEDILPIYGYGEVQIEREVFVPILSPVPRRAIVTRSLAVVGLPALARHAVVELLECGHRAIRDVSILPYSPAVARPCLHCHHAGRPAGATCPLCTGELSQLPEGFRALG